MTTVLPTEFADLEPFADWCLDTERARYDKRLATTLAEMQVFYDAIVPRYEAAVTYLDGLGLDDLPDDATNLLHLLYSMIQVSFPVEVWRQPKVPDTGSATFDCFIEPVP